jgi:hypothetical protein
MASENLTRTTYRDPTSPGNPIRGGDAARAEADRDMEQFYRPLERAHGSALHGWGVAAGLAVEAVPNAPGLTILPGVALDGTGRHVCLIAGGQAEVGPQADVAGTPPQLVPVAAAGAALSTAGLSGDKLLTVEFWETFDYPAHAAPGIFQYLHTPWLRLLDAAGFRDDGRRVVLARVTLGANADAGKVTALAEGPRRAAGVPAGSVTLRQPRGGRDPGLRVGEEVAGEIRPLPGGRMALVTGAVAIQAGGAAEFVVIDAAAARVGIGTAPQAALDVKGAIRAGGSEVRFTDPNHNLGAGPAPGEAAIENAADQNALVILGRAGAAEGRKVTVSDHLTVQGNISTTGMVDGRKISADGEKLDQAVQQLTAVSNSLRNLLDQVNHLRQQVQDLMDYAPFGIPVTWVGTTGVLFDLPTDRAIKIWYDEGMNASVGIIYYTADSKQHPEFVQRGSYKVISAKSLTIQGFPNEKGRYLIIPN